MVTRQQFIDGTAYPPAATGLRGSHPGSFEVAHALRDGERFEVDGLADGDDVDLVVVGAGISGLAAAWFYRREHPDATILLLDNHDDFGGHAKRNEFTVDGRFLLGYGGSEALQSPEALYGPEAKELLARARRRPPSVRATTSTPTSIPRWACRAASSSPRRRSARTRLVTGDPMRMVADDIPADRMHERSPEDFIADFPLPEASRRALVELYTSDARPAAGARRRREGRRPVADQLPRPTSSGTGGSTTSRPTRSRDGRSTSSRSASTASRRSTRWRPATRGSPGCGSRRIRARSPRWRSRTSITSPTATRRSRG